MLGAGGTAGGTAGGMAGGMAGLLEAVQKMVGGKADKEEVQGLRRLLGDKVNLADYQVLPHSCHCMCLLPPSYLPLHVLAASIGCNAVLCFLPTHLFCVLHPWTCAHILSLLFSSELQCVSNQGQLCKHTALHVASEGQHKLLPTTCASGVCFIPCDCLLPALF